MQVGVFYPTLNVYGGGEFVSLVIANTLAKNGYDTVFFSNESINQQELKKFFGETLHPSIKVIVKPSRFQPRGILDFYQTIWRSYILKLKCDIWIDAYSNCVFPWTNISYIHYPFLNHEFYKSKFPYLRNRHILPVSGLPYAIIEKKAVKDSGKLILANSHYTATEVKNFGKKAQVLYPPVPSLYFKNNLHALLRSPRKDLVVTISRFEPGKGLEKIPYIASLTESRTKFAIIGRVHYQDVLFSLQKLIKKLGLTDRVEFFPDASRAEMKKLLCRSKICLHTKTGEHFGIAIVEAMAMGCTPIVHNSGGPTEFVPKELRYNNIYESAAKISKEIDEWTPQKALEMIEIAEKFREENFAKGFIKHFKRYSESII